LVGIVFGFDMTMYPARTRTKSTGRDPRAKGSIVSAETFIALFRTRAELSHAAF
jgi:hypothetical protein